jgi:hypothetical protein
LKIVAIQFGLRNALGVRFILFYIHNGIIEFLNQCKLAFGSYSKLQLMHDTFLKSYAHSFINTNAFISLKCWLTTTPRLIF